MIAAWTRSPASDPATASCWVPPPQHRCTGTGILGASQRILSVCRVHWKRREAWGTPCCHGRGDDGGEPPRRGAVGKRAGGMQRVEGREGAQATRVLVVDDEPHIVDFITLGLQRLGYEVRSAYEGQQGLAAVQEWQPDVVILDVMLPGLDGLQVCRRGRARSAVPILLLTARG